MSVSKFPLTLSRVVQTDLPATPMMAAVTIASIRAHGVNKLLVYCLGKRDGDWPCNHEGTLPVDHFQSDECLRDIEARCRCTKCGWQRADLRPDYCNEQSPLCGGGWMMPPFSRKR
jgi:hypothetical protein